MTHELRVFAVVVAAFATTAAASTTAAHISASGPAPKVSTPVWAPRGERIAYLRQPADGWSDQVETVLADGSDRRVLTPRDLGDVDGFTWSPEGARLAIARHPPGEDAAGRLSIVAARGGTRRTILVTTPYDALNPLWWAPRGDRIAANGDGRFWIVAAAGSFRWKIDRSVWTAAWSADGSRLAYSWFEAFPNQDTEREYGDSPIEIVDRNGATVATLPPEEGAFWVTDFAWSPDGRALVYATMPYSWFDSDDPTTWGPPIVHVVSLTDSGAARVGFAVPGDAPTWSRRDVIAYVTGFRNSERGGDPSAVQLARPDGTALIRIDDATAPQWSPDGSRLLFERKGAIWVSDWAGRRQRRVVVGRDASWAPGGRRFAFVRARCGASGGLFVTSLDGRARRIVPPGC